MSAHRLAETAEWRTSKGDILRGAPGDWWVEGPDGVVRTVTDTEFRATYEDLGQGRFRRSGVVTARQVKADEVVETLEGTARATPGMWVVTGPNGNSWPVPDEVFREGYAEL